MNIPKGVTIINDFAFHRGCYTSVTVPNGVKSIGRDAFSWGRKLESVSLPEGLESIGKFAFYNQVLTSLVIPSSVKKLEQEAFCGCGNLTEVTMLGERPETGENIFGWCGKLKAIHVPANAKSWAGMKEWLGIPLVFDAECLLYLYS